MLVRLTRTVSSRKDYHVQLEITKDNALELVEGLAQHGLEVFLTKGEVHTCQLGVENFPVVPTVADALRHLRPRGR